MVVTRLYIEFDFLHWEWICSVLSQTHGALNSISFCFQDNRVGTGTGKYKTNQLFRTRQGHACLVPIRGLLHESDFGRACEATRLGNGNVFIISISFIVSWSNLYDSLLAETLLPSIPHVNLIFNRGFLIRWSRIMHLWPKTRDTGNTQPGFAAI